MCYAGIAVYLAPELINNASLDLNSIDYEDCGTSVDSAEALFQPSNRKRKQVSLAWSHEEQHKTVGLERGALNRNLTTPNSVKIAALEALEALLTVVCVLQPRLCINMDLIHDED